jgi:hypothetical protein
MYIFFEVVRVNFFFVMCIIEVQCLLKHKYAMRKFICCDANMTEINTVAATLIRLVAVLLYFQVLV